MREILLFVITGAFDVADLRSFGSFILRKPSILEQIGKVIVLVPRGNCEYKSGIKIVRGGIDPEKATVKLYFSGEV